MKVKAAGWLSPRPAQYLPRIAEHEGNTTLPEVLPHASPDQLPPRLAPGLRCPHWLEQGHLNWEWPNYLIVRIGAKSFHAKNRSLAGLAVQPSRPPRTNVLIQSVRMPQRIIFRLVLPA